MGWLGWAWDEARREDVNVIGLAIEGRAELLKSIFGEADPERKTGPVTAESFKAFVQTHNQRYDVPARRRKARGGG